TAIVERITSRTHLVNCTRQRADEGAWIGIDDFERLLHQTEKVFAQPRHTGELRAMCHFMDSDPQSEILRPERESLLERQDVRADEVHLVARLLVGHQQVVLTEHALCEVTDERTDFCCRDLPSDWCNRATREPGTHALHQ